MNLLKKTILKILFFSLFFTKIVFANPGIQEAKKTTPNISEQIGNFVIYKGIPISIAIFYLCLIAQKEVQEDFQDQLKPKILFKNFSKEFLSYLFATVFHELSHAICAKIFTQSPIDIALGGSTKNPPFLSSKYLKINGLNPREGSCSFSFDTKFPEQNKLKYALIYLSGGIAGAIASILLSLIITSLEKKPINAKTILVNPLLFEQLTNAIIPLSKDSDAAMIWKNIFHFSEKTIKNAYKIQSFLYVLLDYYIAHTQTECASANSVDKAFITLLNLNTKGCFRFHV